MAPCGGQKERCSGGRQEWHRSWSKGLKKDQGLIHQCHPAPPAPRSRRRETHTLHTHAAISRLGGATWDSRTTEGWEVGGNMEHGLPRLEGPSLVGHRRRGNAGRERETEHDLIFGERRTSRPGACVSVCEGCDKVSPSRLSLPHTVLSPGLTEVLSYL